MTALADSPFPPFDPADASPSPVRDLRFGPVDVSPALEVEDDGEVLASLPLGPFAERYTLLRTLGAGGLGVVQLAYDRTACRNVAIKRIRPSYADASFTERFRREYRALAAIEHTGVPAIYDIGETSAGEPYFTMQIVSGETIRARLNREKTIPPTRALALAIDLGRVLMAVHAAGVIHRDVKPDNVILEGDRVRLIDFGAALLTADYYEQPHLRDVTAVGKRWRTAQVEWIGNAAYMCPQWMNEGKVSPATDVFSVCVVLYEMITGRPLYAREVYQHREIRAEEFAPELGPLVAELRRGVSRVGERHRSMAELVRALEIVRSRLAVQTRRPSLPLVLAASAASFVLGVGATFALLRAPAVEPVVASAPVEPSRIVPPLTVEPPRPEPSSVEPSQDVEAPAPEAAPAPAPTDTPATTERPRAKPSGRRARPAAPPPAATPATWEDRMRDAEAHARSCLEDKGVTLQPLTVAIQPDRPARVRGFSASAPETACVRAALAAFDLVPEGQRMHTFFDP